MILSSRNHKQLDMASFEFLAIIISILGLAASITYYAIVLRNQNETRQAQLMFGLIEGYSNPDANLPVMKLLNLEWIDFDDWQSKYGREADPEMYSYAFSLWQFFNGIGLMLRDGYFNPKTLNDYIGFSVIIQWEKWGEIIKTIRARGNLPKYMQWFEYLYNEIYQCQQQEP